MTNMLGLYMVEEADDTESDDATNDDAEYIAQPTVCDTACTVHFAQL
jgi:hypothetical protein